MAIGDVASGAGKGAATGATIGSFIPGIGTAIGTGIGGILGGIGGGIFGRKKQTKTQRQKQQLIDQLISSLGGEGPYANLFAANQADFEKGFAEPARAQFRNVTAPQVQQQYIQYGQQRGTGIEDTLARAGVDMDQLINQHLLQYQQGKEANQMSGINAILGQADIGQNQSVGSSAMQGLGGYISSPGFGQNIGDIIAGALKKPQPQQGDLEQPLSKGYEQ